MAPKPRLRADVFRFPPPPPSPSRENKVAYNPTKLWSKEQLNALVRGWTGLPKHLQPSPGHTKDWVGITKHLYQSAGGLLDQFYKNQLREKLRTLFGDRRADRRRRPKGIRGAGAKQKSRPVKRQKLRAQEEAGSDELHKPKKKKKKKKQRKKKSI